MGEDVPGPDQMEVEEAEGEQPGHAAEVDLYFRPAAGRRSFDHQQHAGAEQAREQPAHAAVDEDEAERP